MSTPTKYERVDVWLRHSLRCLSQGLASLVSTLSTAASTAFAGVTAFLGVSNVLVNSIRAVVYIDENRGRVRNTFTSLAEALVDFF